MLLLKRFFLQLPPSLPQPFGEEILGFFKGTMHLTDGIVAPSVAVAGYVIAGGMCVAASRGIRDEEIPRVAMLSAAFFVASVVHIPLPPSGVHLLLHGLVGVMLGFRAFLVFPAALALQALLAGHGGITVLGVNTCLFGFPAWAAYGLYLLGCRSGWLSPSVAGGIAGGLAVMLSGLILGVILWSVGDSFKNIALYVFVAHLPVAVIEGIMTGFCVRYLVRGRPEMIHRGSP